MGDRPQFLEFSLNGATARAELLWDKAPKTCEAIVAQLPIESFAVHGKNSGAEALLLTPSVIKDLPQDGSENATTDHQLLDVMFGFEPAGSCAMGAGSSDASEIAWIYHPAAQACFWVSEHGYPHDKPPFKRVAANLNVFARFLPDDAASKLEDFYAASRKLIEMGKTTITVTAVA